MRRQVVGAEAGAFIDLLGHHDLATERLGQFLEAGGDVDRVADHRELGMVLVADIAGDGDAGVNADAKPDRLGQRVGERAIQRLDPGRDRGAGSDRLAAGGFRPRAHAEQREQPVAQDLVRLPARAKTARLTALRNWLMTNTVSNGSRSSASRLDPRMSTNMMTT